MQRLIIVYIVYINGIYVVLAVSCFISAFAQRGILKYQGVWKCLTPGRLLLLAAKGRNWEVGALLESSAG